MHVVGNSLTQAKIGVTTSAFYMVQGLIWFSIIGYGDYAERRRVGRNCFPGNTVIYLAPVAGRVAGFGLALRAQETQSYLSRFSLLRSVRTECRQIDNHANGDKR